MNCKPYYTEKPFSICNNWIPDPIQGREHGNPTGVADAQKGQTLRRLTEIPLGTCEYKICRIGNSKNPNCQIILCRLSLRGVVLGDRGPAVPKAVQRGGCPSGVGRLARSAPTYYHRESRSTGNRRGYQSRWPAQQAIPRGLVGTPQARGGGHGWGDAGVASGEAIAHYGLLSAAGGFQGHTIHVGASSPRGIWTHLGYTSFKLPFDSPVARG